MIAERVLRTVRGGRSADILRPARVARGPAPRREARRGCVARVELIAASRARPPGTNEAGTRHRAHGSARVNEPTRDTNATPGSVRDRGGHAARAERGGFHRELVSPAMNTRETEVPASCWTVRASVRSPVKGGRLVSLRPTRPREKSAPEAAIFSFLFGTSRTTRAKGRVSSPKIETKRPFVFRSQRIRLAPSSSTPTRTTSVSGKLYPSTFSRTRFFRTMTTPQQRNLISSAGFIGLVAAMKEPTETFVKCNQVRLRALRSRSQTLFA